MGVDDEVSGPYGLRCLMARRLVEAGVRFVQVTTSPGQPWDHHDKLGERLPKIAAETDQGAAALVKDLGRKGHARRNHRDVGWRVRPLANNAAQRRP